MGSYTLTNKAVQDLSSIWEYTVDTWSEKQADKYYIMLLDSCQDIADGKVMGKYYPVVSTEILGFKAGQHILFYRKLSITKVEIARILHSQMDLKNRLQE
ncbi:MAG: plasmid stabilization system [Chitinophagaceae bacterium]|nr:MAG: plasmid stabilization [Chitinophagaceae bacterium]TXT31120.1 MAG: plasmid stabilization system [Chitinophagaceae bacterium]